MSASSLHLVALTLQRSNLVNQAVYGTFSSRKEAEIVVSRGSVLELLRPDSREGTLRSVSVVDTYSVVRSLAAFRLTGASRDYVVVGADSGKITVLEFDDDAAAFKPVHCEAFGKTGCRRIVPGQYLAVDPKGRAIMISAVEKQKMVYILNRDASSRLTISSPLEAHKASTVVFDSCGVDVDFDNPVFAVIELDYAEADQDATGEALYETEKHLTYYELDLGLNHVTRKWSEPISRTASLCLTVPGGAQGPGGVLICGENWVAYKHEGHPEVRAPLPRRLDYPAERGLLVVATAIHKQKDLFFFLLQSEVGDLYKVTLEWEAAEVTDLLVQYFDTCPVANARTLCITKTGLLFVGSEFGDHQLYIFQKIQPDDGDEWVSTRAINDPELGDDSISAAKVAPVFRPRARPANLERVTSLASCAPLTDLVVADVAREGAPQLHALCGRGPHAALRTLRYGHKVNEMARSELPGHPCAIWTISRAPDDAHDRYIVVGFTNATLVLSIGDTVEEVSDSGVDTGQPTLDVALLRDGSMVQVHPHAIRHIKRDKRVQEWKTPGARAISRACCNDRQVCIALQGGELLYFELDDAMQLTEMQTKELGVDVSCLDVGRVPAGRQRAPFAALGCADATTRIVSLDPSELLNQLATIQLGARPETVRLVDFGDGAALGAGLQLCVGLTNGVLQRCEVDAATGELTDSRTRFLGAAPVRLFRARVLERTALLAVSSRSWLVRMVGGGGGGGGGAAQVAMAPLSFDRLEHAAPFATEHVPEGVVAIAGSTLLILVVDRAGLEARAEFNARATPLRYTPRKCVHMPGTSRLAVVQADHNAYNVTERAILDEQLKQAEAAMAEAAGGVGGVVGGAAAMDTDGAEPGEEEGDEPPPRLIGPMPPAAGKWASCLSVLEPSADEPGALVEAACADLDNNEAPLSVCACAFASHGAEPLIVVGTAKDLTFHPRQHGGCFLRVYQVVEGAPAASADGAAAAARPRLELLHVTEIEDVPLAITPFHGRLLAGVGQSLRVYELGKRKLLRKSEVHHALPSMLVKVATMADRIYCADLTDSLLFAKYRRDTNAIAVFADDETGRMVTTFCVLDYDTVVGADKFGNVFVLRLPAETSDDIDNPTGNRVLWDSGVLNGAPTKLEQLCMYHVGEVVTSLTKCALAPGSADAIIFTTISGALGALLPSTTRDDKDFFMHLEMHLRQEKTLLTGREHIQYRSYFMPVKEVTDGDFCEEFSGLPPKAQEQIATDLERTPAEVMKKLESLRERLL